MIPIHGILRPVALMASLIAAGTVLSPAFGQNDFEHSPSATQENQPSYSNNWSSDSDNTINTENDPDLHAEDSATTEGNTANQINNLYQQNNPVMTNNYSPMQPAQMGLQQIIKVLCSIGGSAQEDAIAGDACDFIS